jgi:cysteine sulfinate desulfinase/cysteine desulfurase-like protein
VGVRRNTCGFLESLGYEVTRLGVDGGGLVDPANLAEALEGHAREGIPVRLVSVMTANNEVGTIQPVRELAALAREHGALFHTDAVQAAGKILLDVEELGVDLLTLSGHKFHGPKGVGILYLRKGVELEPLVHGGKQEGGLRAGTENVAAIVGMGAAAERAQMNGLERMDAVVELRDRLEDTIRKVIPEARLNGHRYRRLPNTLNLVLPGLRGESLVIALDRKGIALSSGSACKSGSPEPSHALMALGISEADAHCSVRFSLSAETTEEDMTYVGEVLAQVLEELETTVRFLPCK